MAYVNNEIVIEAPLDDVWDAMNDIEKHRELGFLVVLEIGGLDVFGFVGDVRAQQAR